MVIKKNYPLKKLTAMGLGGPARYFTTIRSEKELLGALKWAKRRHLAVYVVGEGSNLVPSDRGFSGLIIQNKIQEFDLSTPSLSPPYHGGDKIVVGAGNNLLKFIFKLDNLGLAGLEKMAGIPGTVGGAIYGCAGAYGQEIKDCIINVRIWDDKKFRTISKAGCKFTYRGSIFKKHKDWIITGATLKLSRDQGLMAISKDIIKLREMKYRPGLKCPGSFFKNIKLSEIPARKRRQLVRRVERDRIRYGKLPSAVLLEAVGAKRMGEGAIKVAPHHANLIYNSGRGTARDVKRLATKLKQLVKKHFSVKIEEEVQYL